MPLTSLRLLAVCIGLAIGIPVALGILWRRGPRTATWALPLVLASVLAAQGSAMAAVAVQVNRVYGTYPSWSALFGTPVAPPVLSGSRRVFPPGVVGSASDTGRYQRIRLTGPRSGISQTVITWLPPQYHDPRYARTRFPVVMVLGGAQVHISYVVQRLDFARTASAEIRSGRVAPFVAVFPEINVGLPVETECTDYPGSTQAYTWLNQDVRNWATGALRVAPDAQSWSVIGWSTGGYCAALLHLRNPERFGAAASVEGYFTPAPDRNTGNLAQLLNQYPNLAHESTPEWLILNHPPRQVHLLVMTSNTDPQSRPQAEQFLRRTRGLPGIQPYLIPNLGHSLDAYRAVLGPILGWFAIVGKA